MINCGVVMCWFVIHVTFISVLLGNNFLCFKKIKLASIYDQYIYKSICKYEYKCVIPSWLYYCISNSYYY